MKNLIKLSSLLCISILVSCSSDDTPPDDPVEFNLDDIQGNWYRVGGNNPANNGMLVNVNNNTGTVEIPLGSGFEVGDIKWKDIVATAQRSYAHKELGSDFNYYDATMNLGTDDTLRINVANSGAGNEQKWVRQYTAIEPHDCNPYELESFTDQIISNWSEANEVDTFPGLLQAVSEPAGGYYTVTLTATESVPALSIQVPGDPYPIINGSAAGSNTPQSRKVAFLAHPGISYDATANPFINGTTWPETYEINWQYTGIMDCYEPNDIFEAAKAIPKNAILEAYANAGFISVNAINENIYDWYKIILQAPSKLEVEIVQSPSDRFMDTRFVREDQSAINASYTVISGNTNNNEPGTLYKLTSNSTLNPGTYYLRMDGGTPRSYQYDINAGETKPDHWSTPYKFKVVALAP